MIVELIDRSGHVRQSYSFDQNRVSIGRGYNNLIVINDPYMDAEHLTVEYDFVLEKFFVRNLNALNGVHVQDVGYKKKQNRR